MIDKFYELLSKWQQRYDDAERVIENGQFRKRMNTFLQGQKLAYAMCVSELREVLEVLEEHERNIEQRDPYGVITWDTIHRTAKTMEKVMGKAHATNGGDSRKTTTHCPGLQR